MRSRAGSLVLAILALGTWAHGDIDDAFRREHEYATRTILCDCGCSPQSVHACACGRAADMRAEMATAIRGGKTGAEVVDGYVARHGEKIRICPTASGFNLLAWLGPGVALLAGAVGSVVVLRRWKDASLAREAATPSSPPAADDPYVARIQEHLREYE